MHEELLIAKLAGYIHVSSFAEFEISVPLFIEFGLLEEVGVLYTSTIDIEIEGSFTIVPGILFSLKRVK